METTEARRSRLVAQAALMRANRTYPEDYVSKQIDRTQRVISRLAPDNIASIPIAMALENKVWTVDLHIRTATEEHECSGSGRRLEDAIEKARSLLYPILEDKIIADHSPEGTQP